MRPLFYRFVIIFLLSVTAVSAELIQTPMVQSRWNVSKSNIACRLTHDIPGYGTAGFILEGGKPLVFYLQPRQLRQPIARASLSARASPWLHETGAQKSYQVSLYSPKWLRKDARFAVRGNAADRMFEALGIGLIPTFSYLRGANGSSMLETRVGISSVNFGSSHEQLNLCRQQLLPFAVAEIQDRILYFEFHGKTPSVPAGHFFHRIDQYLKAIKSGSVLVGNESWAINDPLSKKWFNSRFESIKSALVKAGVKKTSIKKRAHLPNTIDDRNIRLHLFGPEGLRTYHYSRKSPLLTKNNKSRLALLARLFLENFSSGKLVVNGHTDGTGRRTANKQLGAKLAVQVKNYLQERGINGTQIVVRSFGEARPVFSNRSREGRAKNRRIVINLAS